MIEKVYKEWLSRTDEKEITGSLEDDIRMIADLDYTFESLLIDIGVKELAKYIALKGVKLKGNHKRVKSKGFSKHTKKA